MFNTRLFQAYVIPISAYLSISIAGGYGTGREIVEFFTQYGVYEGLLGMLGSAIVISILAAFTFELARQMKSYDYRTFFKILIGPFWVVFEILYISMMLLVLAVVGSAAGAMIAEHTPIPEKVGLLIMLGVIAILTFYGRELIQKVLVYLTVLLYFAFILYFIFILSANADAISQQLVDASFPSRLDWLLPASKFTLYSAPIAAFIIFATRGIKTRKEALLCGGLCGVFYLTPALLFHISFLAALPEITSRTVPVHWMINNLNNGFLLPIYLMAMIGTFLGTGFGFIQSLNERLDTWSMEKLGRVLAPSTHSIVAITGLSLSALLGQLGVIALIAQGYGTMAWGFLIVFVLPVFFIGVKRIILNKKPDQEIPTVE